MLFFFERRKTGKVNFGTARAADGFIKRDDLNLDVWGLDGWHEEISNDNVEFYVSHVKIK